MRLFIPVLVLLVSGCEFVGLACTEIGCIDHLRVSVLDDAAEPVRTFSGQADLSDGTTIAFSCTDGAGEGVGYTCYDNSVILQTSDESVALRVGAAEGDFEDTLEPEYAISTPNGEECPPECHEAEVEIELVACGDCG